MALPLKASSNTNSESDGINSANASRSPQLRARRANQQNAPTHSSPLSSTQIYNNVVRSYDDIIDVLNLNCLPDLSCVHTRIEWYSQCGFLSLPPLVILPCGTQCHVCNGSSRKTFLPVIYSGAIKFLKSTRLSKTLPLLMDHDNSNNIINSLWKDKDWCKDIFGTKSPSKGNVVSFFFQMIATKIISFELVNTSGLKCVIT